MKKIIRSSGIFILIGLILAGCTQLDQKDYLDQINHTAEQTNKSQLQIQFNNVGQGDSVLIDYGEFEMLIDGGKPQYGQSVCDQISLYVDGQIEYVLASHPDSDHIGGLIDVMSTYDVLNVIDSGFENSGSTYDAYKGQRYKHHVIWDDNMVIQEGDLTIEMIDLGDKFPNPNDHSIILYVTLGQKKFLFTGDAGSNIEDELVDQGLARDVDVFKAAHHGSKYSNSMKFLEQIKPEFVIVSYGQNDYGHPNQEAMERFEHFTDQIYSTYENGSVMVCSDGEKVWLNKAVEVAEKETNHGLFIKSVDKKAEYVVLANETDKSIILNDYWLKSVRGNQEYYFPEGTKIDPGQELLIGGYDAKDFVDLIWEENGGIWNNSEKDDAELYFSDECIFLYEN